MPTKNPTKDQLHKWQKDEYERNKDRHAARSKAYYIAHREEILAYSRVYYQANKERVLTKIRQCNSKRVDEISESAKIRRLFREYGLTEEEFREMLEGQGGLCPICRKELKGKSNICVDHDHTTGTIRGLLCRKCNAAIGQFDDSIDMMNRAIAYLRNTTEPKKRNE